MIDFLLNFLGDGFGLIAKSVSGLINLISRPLAYVLSFFEGIFYAIYQLFLIVGKVIMIFVALIQFFGALVAGFMRTIYSLLTIDFYKAPVHYPNVAMQGISAVLDQLRPTGLLTVVPLIILAIVWGLFIKKIVGLIGGEIKADA
jgi:hypothetical protein